MSKGELEEKCSKEIHKILEKYKCFLDITMRANPDGMTCDIVIKAQEQEVKNA